MAKSRAEIQRQYRARLKENKAAYEEYLLKARKRKEKNYVPANKLTRKEKRERNEKNKEYLKRHRLKKRLNQLQDENQVLPETSGYETASTSDLTPAITIRMPFPKRRDGARMRVTKALDEKRKEFKKLKDSYAELQRKYSRNIRSIQRMKQKLKNHKGQRVSTNDACMSPRSLTKQQMSRAGLSKKQASKVKKQLLLGNTILPEMSDKSPNSKHPVSAIKSFSRKLIKKYRLITKLSQSTGVTRKVLTSVSKLRRRREMEKNKESVIEFLERDDNSRQNPGKKDKLKCDGESYQTRTLNDYLRNLHNKYLSENPNVKLSLTSFCRIRPSYIKLTSFTSRSSCLCTKHQNMALCLKALRLSGLDIPLNPETFISEDKHKETVTRNVQAEITYGQWKRVPVEEKGRTKMVTKIVESRLPKDEFLQTFQKQTEEFEAHVKRVRHQYREIRRLKDGLNTDEVILHMDFAENYLCKSMDEVQSAYWSQTAVTLHPIVIYFRKENEPNLMHQSIVIISDELGHNSITVRAFIQSVIPMVKVLVPGVKKVHYWTDSPTSQYRNKFIFHTIANHEALYGLKAVWNFFEAGHGKGPCDGLGGITKRLADEAVRAGKSSIQNAIDFYQWTQSSACTMTNVQFLFVSSNNCQQVGKGDIYDLKPIKGTLKLHAVVGQTKDSIFVSEVSCYCDNCIVGQYDCPQWRIESILPKLKTPGPNESGNVQDELEPVNNLVQSLEKQLELGDFVAAMYNRNWYVGKIVEIDEEDEEIEVTFMKRSKNLYQWPIHEDKIWIGFPDIICKIEEPLPTGKTERMFRLDNKEFNRIQNALGKNAN